MSAGVRRLRKAFCFALVLATCTAARVSGAEYAWQLPPGFPEPVVPADNPMSVAKVELGARLFSDPRLSLTGRHSCQSCHSPALAFTDGLARSRGVTGEALELNAPTLLNAAYLVSYGWDDAGVRSLEQQMRGPLFHPRELGLAGREAHVEATLAADTQLAREFAQAFPGKSPAVTLDNVIRAIAAYERTLFAADSAFDRYVFGGDHQALSAAQKQGMRLFFSERTGCSACHGGINFAGPWVDRAHPAADAVFADTGTGKAVRVPTLRNLARTAPFMHDGRFATLEAVLVHYEQLAAGPPAHPGLDARLRRATLTTAERADLLAFLESLNDAG